MVQCGMGVRLTPAVRSRRPGRADDWGVSRKRTLYLLRHAKSSWDDPALPDRDRPLAPRGYRACELVAEHLHLHKITPALVLCSSSTRTRETLDRVSVGFSRPVSPRRRPLRRAAAELLARLRTVDSAASVLLIGHQPAVELAVSLVGAEQRRGALNGKFPTGALATSPSGSWAALAETATLTAFVKLRAESGRKPDAA